MEREAFLDRLRERLRTPAPTSLAHPLTEQVRTPHPRFHDFDPDGDLAPQFLAQVEAHGGTARRASSSADLRAVVEEVADAHGVRRVVRSLDPEVTDLDLGDLVEVEREPSSAATADLGVTGAVWGVAATGSVVVDAGRAGGRTASLLPPVHVAVVRAGQLVATPGDVWRALPVTYGRDDLPSQLVFITGPSRSADIEGILTVGIHGPGHLWVVLLDEDRPGEG